jgi:chromate transporter
VERLRGHRALAGALAAITAAVVGVIANLALWFALNLLFEEQVRVRQLGMDVLLPVPGTLHLPMLVLAAIACVLVFRLRLGVLAVLALCAIMGVAWTLLSVPG